MVSVVVSSFQLGALKTGRSPIILEKRSMLLIFITVLTSGSLRTKETVMNRRMRLKIGNNVSILLPILPGLNDAYS